MGDYRNHTLFDFFEDEEEELPYYDHVKGELKGTQIAKARKFVSLGLVEPVDEDTWFVHPIEGYNKRTYTVVRDGDEWSCNCQYNRTKGKICSHILAVWIFENLIEL